MQKTLGFFLIIIALIQGCDRYMVYEQYRTMPSEKWHKDSLKNYNFTIKDSLTIYNMYVNVRNTGKYSFSNLIVFVETDLPGKSTLRDTLNCILADESGEWLGSGFGSIWTSKIPYKIKIRFPRKGKYHVDIQHGMRREVLKGITDIGIRIEKAH